MRLIVFVLACNTFHFEKAITPSGVPCSDMPIVPAGTAVDKPLHRLRPVRSAYACVTDAERLESLRREACRAGGDAVIEASNEEIHGENGAVLIVASGTAVLWTSDTQQVKPR